LNVSDTTAQATQNFHVRYYTTPIARSQPKRRAVTSDQLRNPEGFERALNTASADEANPYSRTYLRCFLVYYSTSFTVMARRKLAQLGGCGFGRDVALWAP